MNEKVVEALREIARYARKHATPEVYTSGDWAWVLSHIEFAMREMEQAKEWTVQHRPHMNGPDGWAAVAPAGGEEFECRLKQDALRLKERLSRLERIERTAREVVASNEGRLKSDVAALVSRDKLNALDRALGDGE